MTVLSAAAVMLRLTPRDRALLLVLQELRYLTVHQIRDACYPSITVPSMSHRLTVLRARGLIECLGRRSFEDARRFWGLAALGRTAAAALSAAGPARPRPAVVAALQMDHLVATNQVFCGLCAEHRAGRLRPCAWFGSQHARVDLGLAHLTPDALILAAAPEDRPWLYCLERDRGTMAAGALAGKFDRYRLMYRTARQRRGDPLWDALDESWLLLACDDETRARDAARLAARAGLDRVWAGAASRCAGALAEAMADLPEPAAVEGARGAVVLPGLSGGIALAEGFPGALPDGAAVEAGARAEVRS